LAASHRVSDIKAIIASVQRRYLLNVDTVGPPLPRQFHERILIRLAPAIGPPVLAF
jgi:hypothetical protein